MSVLSYQQHQSCVDVPPDLHVMGPTKLRVGEFLRRDLDLVGILHEDLQ